MNSRQIQRVSRINMIKTTLDRALIENKALSYKKFTARLMVDFGVSRRTAKEYLDCLIETDYCKKEDDYLYKRVDGDPEETIRDISQPTLTVVDASAKDEESIAIRRILTEGVEEE